MRKNKVIFIIVAILSVVAAILVFQNRKSTLKRGMAEFAIADTSSVTKIYLADKRNNEVLLTRISPDKWLLNDSLNARIEGVSHMLVTMSKLAVMAPVSKSSYNTVLKRMAASSVKVEIYVEGYKINLFNRIKLFPVEKLAKVYYVGSATPDNMGTYMLMEDADVPFIVYRPGLRGFVSAVYSTRINDWRDHTIFASKPSEIESIQIEFPGTPEYSYVIKKSGDRNLEISQLISGVDLKDFDTDRMMGFINGFRKIRFESLLDERDKPLADSILHSTPLHIITLTDTSGHVNRIKTFRRINTAGDYDFDGNLLPHDVNRLFAWINNEKELVLIQYFVFDPITRPFPYFFREQE
nr:DUF4340 domain-containing protein [Bacteroidota bacterium]